MKNTQLYLTLIFFTSLTPNTKAMMVEDLGLRSPLRTPIAPEESSPEKIFHLPLRSEFLMRITNYKKLMVIKEKKDLLLLIDRFIGYELGLRVNEENRTWFINAMELDLADLGKDLPSSSPVSLNTQEERPSRVLAPSEKCPHLTSTENLLKVKKMLLDIRKVEPVIEKILPPKLKNWLIDLNKKPAGPNKKPMAPKISKKQRINKSNLKKVPNKSILSFFKSLS